MTSAKRDKFIELAEKRVNKAIKTMRLIGNLSNKSNYEYSDELVNEIVGALERELRDLKRKFSPGKVEGHQDFTFSKRSK
ncbi:hypothetical protein [Desulfopila inferna]|uniref:hypothetical protein n=1 Tax=Desulfopila inferna TaxID=468528 RepID=UPI00196347A0|nr:hypothetical protein [Desulfopila inferna]MBM9606736.1 hypothetical protein [Desulfopila inferna]